MSNEASWNNDDVHDDTKYERKGSFDSQGKAARRSMAEKEPEVEFNAANFPKAAKIDFHNLEYTVGVGSRKELQILKGCSGVCLPGQTTFIMGASGAGKTSLLNVLSDRVKIGGKSTLKGEVLVNDKALN